MANQGRIIAAMEPHSASLATAQLGARLAAGLGVTLELYTPVYNPHVSLRHFNGRESLQRARDSLVRRHRERLEGIARSLAGASVECEACWDHPPEEALIRRVLEQAAVLLIVRLPEVAGAGRGRLSSLQWQLVRHCPAPLLLTRGKTWGDAPVIVAAVDPTGRHGRGDELDVGILRSAERLAQASRGTVLAFHAWERSLRARIGEREESLAADLPEAEIENRHREAVYSALGASGVAPARIAFVEGRPEDALPEYCRETGAELVVMGAIARNPFGRIFIGSTAERVLDRLPCDLLVVKPESFRTPVPRDPWPREDAVGPVFGVPGI